LVAHFFFVSTFYATKEDLGSAYKKPSLESFFDALIREKDKLLQFGLIITMGTSTTTLMSQHKDKSKNPKKKHAHHNNKKNRGPKPSQLDIATFVGKMVMRSPNGLIS
jgi:hypothetical protein